MNSGRSLEHSSRMSVKSVAKFGFEGVHSLDRQLLFIIAVEFSLGFKHMPSRTEIEKVNFLL